MDSDVDRENKFQASRDEASLGVSFTSFMTLVVFFFIGLLITGDASLQIQLRLPLCFLFLSAFAFVFSTLLYANATCQSTREDIKRVYSHMGFGDLLSEILGLFFMLYAIPLVILGYSPDLFLAIFLLVSVGVVLFFYHYLGYAILEDYLPAGEMLRIISGFIILHILIFYFTYSGQKILMYVTALLLAALNIMLLIKCYCSKENLNPGHKKL